MVAKEIADGEIYPLKAGPYIYSGAKPPLFYWTIGLAGKVGNFSETSLRFFTTFCGWLILVLFCFGNYLESFAVRISATITLGASLLFFSHARRVQMDIPALLFLLGFILLFQKEDEKIRVRNLCLAGICLFFAYMLKNTLLIFPLLGLLAYCASEKFSKRARGDMARIGIPLAIGMIIWHGIEFIVVGRDFVSQTVGPIANAASKPVSTVKQSPFFYLFSWARNEPVLLTLFLVGTAGSWIKRKQWLRSRQAFYLGWLVFGSMLLSALGTKAERYSLALAPIAIILAFTVLERSRFKRLIVVVPVISIGLFLAKGKDVWQPHFNEFSQMGLKEIVLAANDANDSKGPLYVFDTYFAQPMFYSQTPVKEILFDDGRFKALQENWFIRSSSLVEKTDYLQFRKDLVHEKIDRLIMRSDDFLKYGRGLNLNIVDMHAGFLLLTKKPAKLKVVDEKFTTEALLLDAFFRLTINDQEEASEILTKIIDRNDSLVGASCIIGAALLSEPYQIPLSLGACKQHLEAADIKTVVSLGQMLDAHGLKVASGKLLMAANQVWGVK